MLAYLQSKLPAKWGNIHVWSFLSLLKVSCISGREKLVFSLAFIIARTHGWLVSSHSPTRTSSSSSAELLPRLSASSLLSSRMSLCQVNLSILCFVEFCQAVSPAYLHHSEWQPSSVSMAPLFWCDPGTWWECIPSPPPGHWGGY